MMRRTTLADRQEIIALKRGGLCHAEVALRTGWSHATVRKVWDRYQHAGEGGLLAPSTGRPATGRLSTFAWRVRYVALRLKRQRPHAGPDVILADMAVRPSLHGLRLPSSASLGAYFSQFGARLITPRRHLQLPGQRSAVARVRQVHECWQLDFDEGLHWSGVGWVNVMNLVDTLSGVKLGSYVQLTSPRPPRPRLSWPQIRAHLRDALSRWGRPDRIRTDHDRRLVAEGDYPVPMPFTLWLVGLGIEHELIQRVTQNGGVERSHRTWEGRLLDLALGDNAVVLQDYVNYEIWRMNAVLPSRGRGCQRRPPLLVYPQTRTPRRLYRAAEETSIFQLAQVEDYLADGRWLRRTSAKGQFHFAAAMLNVGTRYGRQTVVIRFDPTRHTFQVTLAQSEAVLLTFRPSWLSVASITGLSG